MEEQEIELPEFSEEERKPVGKWWHGAIGGLFIAWLATLISPFVLNPRALELLLQSTATFKWLFFLLDCALRFVPIAALGFVLGTIIGVVGKRRKWGRTAAATPSAQLAFLIHCRIRGPQCEALTGKPYLAVDPEKSQPE